MITPLKDITKKDALRLAKIEAYYTGNVTVIKIDVEKIEIKITNTGAFPYERNDSQVIRFDNLSHRGYLYLKECGYTVDTFYTDYVKQLKTEL